MVALTYKMGRWDKWGWTNVWILEYSFAKSFVNYSQGIATLL